MRSISWIIGIALFATFDLAARAEYASPLDALDPDTRLWVERSCPKSLGPSLYSSCVNRQVSALSRGTPNLSDLSDADRRWIAGSCPRTLGPHLYISCANRQVAALEAGVPDISDLSPGNQEWLRASCPKSLGPMLYRSCLSREIQALRSMSGENSATTVTASPVPRTNSTNAPQRGHYDPSVLQAQAILKSLGLYYGSLDDIAGPQTKTAIRSFQTVVGMDATGNLDTATAVALFAFTARPTYGGYSNTVDCEGYNSETGTYVYGECDDGDFEGYDSETGSYVHGDCEADGDLEAYDSESGTYVYGECD